MIVKIFLIDDKAAATESDFWDWTVAARREAGLSDHVVFGHSTELTAIDNEGKWTGTFEYTRTTSDDGVSPIGTDAPNILLLDVFDEYGPGQRLYGLDIYQWFRKTHGFAPFVVVATQDNDAAHGAFPRGDDRLIIADDSTVRSIRPQLVRLLGSLDTTRIERPTSRTLLVGYLDRGLSAQQSRHATPEEWLSFLQEVLTGFTVKVVEDREVEDLPFRGQPFVLVGTGGSLAKFAKRQGKILETHGYCWFAALDCPELPWPVPRGRVADMVHDWSQRSRAKARSVAQSLQLLEKLTNIVGMSWTSRVIREFVARVGPTDSHVLIEGETGTGKEEMAKALHASHPIRSAREWVSENFAALTGDTAASEVRGTGRRVATLVDASVGLVERADHSTLMLDEIGKMNREVQHMLLRVIEDRCIRRRGETGQPTVVDVRIVAATDVDMTDAVKRGEFDRGLYTRIAVERFRIAPLRERQSDFVPLLFHFLGDGWELDLAAVKRLLEQPWDGNVRDLRNFCERAKSETLDRPVLTLNLVKEFMPRASDSEASQPDPRADPPEKAPEPAQRTPTVPAQPDPTPKPDPRPPDKLVLPLDRECGPNPHCRAYLASLFGTAPWSGQSWLHHEELAESFRELASESGERFVECLLGMDEAASDVRPHSYLVALVILARSLLLARVGWRKHPEVSPSDLRLHSLQPETMQKLAGCSVFFSASVSSGEVSKGDGSWWETVAKRSLATGYSWRDLWDAAQMMGFQNTARTREAPIPTKTDAKAICAKAAVLEDRPADEAWPAVKFMVRVLGKSARDLENAANWPAQAGEPYPAWAVRSRMVTKRKGGQTILGNNAKQGRVFEINGELVR